MKIKVDNKLLFELTDIQKKVLKNDIKSEILESDIKRRLFHIINHKYIRCFKRLKDEWEPKLSSRVDSVPTDKDKFAELVFKQTDYKDRSARDKEMSSLGQGNASD